MKKILLLFISVMFCISCSNSENTEDIGLSAQVVEFTYEGGNRSLSTKVDTWWISNLRVNGVDIPSNDKNYAFIKGEYETVVGIKASWVTIEKNGKKLNINVSDNTNSESREIIVTLQNSNFFDTVTIIQKPKK